MDDLPPENRDDRIDAAITVAFFAAVASVAWSATFAWAQWLRHRFDAPPAAVQEPALSDGDARIARLESAVDSLGIELERMGEAQRFTVRLLDERLPAALPLPPASRPSTAGGGRTITPH